MDDFSVFTSQDRKDLSYAMCVGGMGIVGGAIGRFGGLPGLLAGAAAGVAYGLLTCKKLSPIIERKLLSRGERLNDQELLQVLRVLRSEAGVDSKADGMYVLSSIRHAASLDGAGSPYGPRACMPMRAAAAHLLAARAA